jgi:hypothetical protein
VNERRLTPTERLFELSMAHAQRSSALPEHTVDISRNAKGQVQFAVAIRGTDAQAVLDEAMRVAAVLEAAYPFLPEAK